MKVVNVFYAAVGAPVVAARKVGDKANAVYGKLNEQATGYTETAGKAVDGWATEGEKVVVRVKDRKVVDEITSKVDLDQAKEQVSKLRDQLEDMLATWRSSFRPEKTEVKETKASTTKTPAAKKSATSKTPAAKKSATTTKTATAKKTTSKTPAAKTGSTKTA